MKPKSNNSRKRVSLPKQGKLVAAGSLPIKILTVLHAAKSNGLNLRELMAACGVPQRNTKDFKDQLKVLERKGKIFDNGVRIFDMRGLETASAVIVSLNKTFGFAKILPDQGEVFIPGKYFLGALPGDQVVLSLSASASGGSPEGQVLKIIKEGDARFTGIVVTNEDRLYVLPDSLIRFPLAIDPRFLNGARPGDKVLCRVTQRGSKHTDHKIKVITGYGDSQTAAHCAQAILDLNGITANFPELAQQEAEHLNARGISKREFEGRLDLRAEQIFTIDGADTKDIDDAVSVKKRGDYYELSVHIADVSHYVRQNSALDQAAYSRGTSIYFVDRVIPMLPPALSNGICSLNPQTDRLAFSCIMTIDQAGKLTEYAFRKSIIHSRLQGVYSEINDLLAGAATKAVQGKYSAVTDSIFLMKELADILTHNRIGRGAPSIETSESQILLNEQGCAVEVRPRTRGASEVLIEEFMLMANEAAASYARTKEIPFVYRVHEPPSAEKLERLKEVLEALGMDTKQIRPDLPASALAGLIEKAKGQPLYPILNNIVLRSISKAKYFEEPLGHYGLVLKNYAQFTSPIRRYPDLFIHRILSESVSASPSAKIRKMFEKGVVSASRQSSETELLAMNLERECAGCYLAETMKNQIGQVFEGTISALSARKLFIELDNTVEGQIKAEDLPNGQYEFDELLEYKNVQTGRTYRIGDRIPVICTGVDVSSGRIDFTVKE